MNEVMIVGSISGISDTREPQINNQIEGKDWEAPVVSEDDWNLGPACSTEHEECESCQ